MVCSGLKQAKIRAGHSSASLDFPQDVYKRQTKELFKLKLWCDENMTIQWTKELFKQKLWCNGKEQSIELRNCLNLHYGVMENNNLSCVIVQRDIQKNCRVKTENTISLFN